MDLSVFSFALAFLQACRASAAGGGAGHEGGAAAVEAGCAVLPDGDGFAPFPFLKGRAVRPADQTRSADGGAVGGAAADGLLAVLPGSGDGEGILLPLPPE